MPTYSLAGDDASEVVKSVLDSYHAPLRDAELIVQVLWAFAVNDKNGDAAGPALTHNGYPALAVFKILNLKDRTTRGADCEIVIDKVAWDELDERERVALIDHELTHCVLKVDSDGKVVRDDLNRPKLRVRKHDFQIGWFDEIVQRHGEASQESIQARAFVAKVGQLYLPGMLVEAEAVA